MRARWCVLAICLWAGTAWGACEEYPSGSGHWYPGSYAAPTLLAGDITSCFSKGSFRAGHTIHLRAGSETWTAGVTYTTTAHIVGAGKDITIINLTSGTAFALDQYDGSTLSNLTIHVPSGGSVTNMTTVRGADDFIIHDLKFSRATAASTYGVLAQGQNGKYEPTGVIYNCDFVNGPRVMVYGSISMTLASGTTAAVQWADQTITWGSKRAVYVEDSTCHKGGPGNCIDGEYGGSFVFRFNTITKGYIEAHASTGPMGNGAHHRAIRRWEIYRNTVSDDATNWVPFRLRGGTGVVFHNTVSGFQLNSLMLDNRRSTEGHCNGKSVVDGNHDAYGYPCRDQIGMGYDSWLWTVANPNPPQVKQPAYFWSNTIKAATYDAFAANVIHQERDFFQDDTPGMRVGLYENMPARCTENQGYWATDQGFWNRKNDTPTVTADGVLYKCTAGNVWTPFYVPYPYPHPLRAN